MNETIEKLILSNCLKNENFVQSTLIFIKDEYFQDRAEREIFKVISKYIKEYSKLPNITATILELKESVDLSDDECETACETIREIAMYDTSDLEWIRSQTEDFCRNKAVYNAILKSISIYEGNEKKLNIHSIPDLLKDAISVNFESRIAGDFFDDAKQRWDYYTCPENKIPFDIEILNQITDGGCGKKTLNVLLGGVHAGKTMSLIHLACGYARLGFNVIYFSMEMREESIFQRMDANFLQMSVNAIPGISEEQFLSKIGRLKQKQYGTIKVREFPSNGAHSEDFRFVINEFKNKHRWMPEIVIVDYLGITASSRLVYGTQNSNTYMKSVAEELRALSTDLDLIVWTAHQFNRCIDVDSQLELESGEMIRIADVKVGDRIKTNGGFEVVVNKYPIEVKSGYRFKTASGKEISSSGNHIFPVLEGLICAEYLKVDDMLFVEEGFWDKITQKDPIAKFETIDIEIAGDRLFFANGILTHNSGMKDSDADMTDIADSIGITNAADFILSISRNEDLDEQGQIVLKQLKNRYKNKSTTPRFVVGCDFEQQRLYDLDIKAQEDIVNPERFSSKTLTEKFKKNL